MSHSFSEIDFVHFEGKYDYPTLSCLDQRRGETIKSDVETMFHIKYFQEGRESVVVAIDCCGCKRLVNQMQDPSLKFTSVQLSSKGT